MFFCWICQRVWKTKMSGKSQKIFKRMINGNPGLGLKSADT